jgi:hypothetical protein
MALRAELGAIAPLKTARRQITRLQHKFDQAVDRDNVRLATFSRRSGIGLHVRRRF